MTSRTGSARRILGDLKSQLVELNSASEEDGWLSLARKGQTNLHATGAARDVGGRYISLLMSKNL